MRISRRLRRDAAARGALRQGQAGPVLERFKHWLDEQADGVLPRSPIGEAVHYARAQWAALTRYVDDGDLTIDNNVSERAIPYCPKTHPMLRLHGNSSAIALLAVA
jgi:hypothetical protein